MRQAKKIKGSLKQLFKSATCEALDFLASMLESKRLMKGFFGFREQGTGNREQGTGGVIAIPAYCLLPTAYCLLPTAYCLLPTDY